MKQALDDASLTYSVVYVSPGTYPRFPVVETDSGAVLQGPAEIQKFLLPDLNPDL